MRSVLTVFLVLAALTASASADQPRWFADVGDSYSAAKWGIPQTDAVGLEIICEGSARLTVRPMLFTPDELKPPPSIVLSVDGEDFVRRGEMIFSQKHGAWQGTAKIVRTDPLIDALRRGSRVAYNFRPEQSADDRFSLSLSGSARAIDAVLDAC